MLLLQNNLGNAAKVASYSTTLQAFLIGNQIGISENCIFQLGFFNLDINRFDGWKIGTTVAERIRGS